MDREGSKSNPFVIVQCGSLKFNQNLFTVFELSCSHTSTHARTDSRLTLYIILSDVDDNKLCERPPQYTPLATSAIDLWPFDLESGVRVTWATSVPILVFLGLYVLDLGPMYATDRRQTDVRRASSLNAPTVGGGIIMYRSVFIILLYPRDVVSAVYATATWLAGWLAGCLSVTAGIVSKRLKPILKLFPPSGSPIF